MTVLFCALQSGEKHQISVKDGAGNRVEISTTVDGEQLYLVPISAIEGVKCEGEIVECRQIVASPISFIKDKKTDIWYTDDITSRVNGNPVKGEN